MSDEQALEATASRSPSESRKPATVYRVFKHDGGDEEGRTWFDLDSVTVEPNSYGSAYLTADLLGKQWGVGKYMYFEAGNSRSRVEFLTVAARTAYYAVEKDAGL